MAQSSEFRAFVSWDHGVSGSYCIGFQVATSNSLSPAKGRGLRSARGSGGDLATKKARSKQATSTSRTAKPNAGPKQNTQTVRHLFRLRVQSDKLRSRSMGETHVCLVLLSRSSGDSPVLRRFSVLCTQLERAAGSGSGFARGDAALYCL